MMNQRRVEIPSGNGQEGKRFRGRFSILELINVVNVLRSFINLINVVGRLIREGNLRAAASPPMSMWVRSREVRRLPTMAWIR